MVGEELHKMPAHAQSYLTRYAYSSRFMEGSDKIVP